MNRKRSNYSGLKKEEDSLFKILDDMSIPKPSKSFKESFDRKLTQMINNNSFQVKERSYNIYLKVAAIAAIFVIGWFLGSINSKDDREILHNLQNQLDNNNNLLVLSLLKQSSVSDRLQATNVSFSMSNLDNQVIVALVNSLENDQDPNVRIRCAEILSLHVRPDTLIKIFEKSLDHQTNPFMQLLLINYISSIDDLRAKSIIKDFTNSDKADEFVRSEVKKTFNL